MALLQESQLRSLAKVRTARAYDSSASVLIDSEIRASSQDSFDVFLSHSFLDKQLILGTTEYLEKMGLSVYVDWKQDSQLSRENVTKATAKLLRDRIGQCDALFYATTTGAKASKWMPWELGFMDGKKGRSAILPIATSESNKNVFAGQEYLGIYPYVSASRDTKGNDRIWIQENDNVYVSYERWIKGRAPYKHG